MTYVSKKEKVFDLPVDQEEGSSVSLNNTETKLKRFPSVSDRRAWTTEECQRYQHLYGLVNGSESNISKSSSFKYIPFDVLLAILMAEKDAYIQELLERQDDARSSGGGKLYKADRYDDSDDDREALIRKDAEVVSLKNKIAGLESQLDDYRDTLTKALHKLENMDATICENDLLKEKISYSEETIRCLEKKKEELEKELEYYRNTYKGPCDIEAKEKFFSANDTWEGGDSEKVFCLSSERDILLQQVEELQRQLERAKTDAAEIDILRKMSESSLEEMSKENECYKKKLETMKYLEVHIEELKKQAQTLTEKYKRESQKANDQLKIININTKELQMLRDERDRLQSKVDELMSYESQYLSLKAKLHQVELIIDENEVLNKKLIELDRLEFENEQLKMRIEQLRNTEAQAAEDKEKIVQLQCAVVEQEDEIQKMLRHIEQMSEGYSEKNEIRRLRVELDEKNGKLKTYEKQLNDIPALEAEIDELKTKLQKCIDDFKTDKDLLVRLQEELEACRKRCQELEEMAPLCRNVNNPNIATSEKDNLTLIDQCSDDQNKELSNQEKKDALMEDADTQFDIIVENKSTITMDDFMVQIEEIETENQKLKLEVSDLTTKISLIDTELTNKKNELLTLLNTKDRKIFTLEAELKDILEDLSSYKKLNETLEEELDVLRENNNKLHEDLESQEEKIKEIREYLGSESKEKEFAFETVKRLEENLDSERAKRETVEDLLKLQKEEANMAKQEIYAYFSKEMDNLREKIYMWKQLSKELEAENEVLREMKEYLEDTENKSLKDFISRLQAEIKVLKSLSKPQLESECEALQEQVKSLLSETDTLIDEIKDLKSSLEAEQNSKDTLEKVVMNLQAELSACVTAGNAVLGREMSTKEILIANLREELSVAKNDLENSKNEVQALKDKNEQSENKVKNFELQTKELKNQINEFQSEEIKLKTNIKELEEREMKLKDITQELVDKTKKLNETAKEKEEREKKLEEIISTLEQKEKMLSDTIQKQELKEKELQEKIEELEKTQKLYEDLTEELTLLKESSDVLKERVKDLEEILKAKEETVKSKEETLRAKEENIKLKEDELEQAKKMAFDAKEDVKKLKSHLEVLKLRLKEKDDGNPVEIQDLSNYENDLDEKFALEEALCKIENELDGLKLKLEECKKMEDEMANLRNKRDSLIEKMSGFEEEINSLKKKLCDFENIKHELDQIKAEKRTDCTDAEISKLYQDLLEQKTKIADLKTENENLKENLKKAEALNEVRKNLQKCIPENLTDTTAEFYTPPTLLSPHSSGPNDLVVEQIPLETHKKEMKDFENFYERKIKYITESNVERIKKLTEFYEKESKCRTKSYYESINSIKSSYENDIKKLVEKHKVSIMRLQGLHEDEVQELNTTYETQMEAMQTQNENLINDLRTEAAEKYKQLREQYNQDIRDLTRKYDELLKDKEAQHLLEKSNAEASLSESTSDIKEAHKQTIDGLTQFYQSSIMELEEKHNQELKKCKKNNLKRIELMKNKYEALLEEERKKYEEQLEEMLIQLKNAGQQGDIVKEKSHYMKKISPRLASPSLDFTEVLQKILNEGLEGLTFDELILVHSKTCFLPQTVMEDDAGDGEYSPRLGNGCRHKVLMSAEKEELLKRIFSLEHEIVLKQLETHEAIVNMEAAEICRIQELKNALFTAQQKNAELKRLLCNQSKHEMNLKIDRYMSDRQANFHETNVVEKVKELEKERAEKKRLEDELQKEKVNVKSLSAAVELEKERHQLQRKRDAEYVESMRQRLEEALNHEQVMENQLDYEVKLRNRLEAELKNLQKSLNSIPDSPFPSYEIETKVAKNIKNYDHNESKEKKHSRSKSRHRSKLKAINNV